MRASTLFSLALSAAAATAYEIPPALKTFYDGVKSGGCTEWLDGNNAQTDGYGKSGFGFCTDTPGVLYLSGPGEIGDMDVDCDGASICGGDGTWQGQTAFDSELQANYGLQMLEAGVHSYVVLGTSDIGVDTGSGGPIAPLSVVAVICNGELHYAVFGDTNGENSTGEASIGLAQLCFPNDNLGGNSGHTEHDVLYLAFSGEDAIPGPGGADWQAKDSVTFEASLKSIGDKMIAKAFGGSASSDDGATGTVEEPSATPTVTSEGEQDDEATDGGVATGDDCDWPGHCAGAVCTADGDCAGENTCSNGICAA